MTSASRVDSRGLRILFLSPYPRGERIVGGVEAVAQALIPALAAQPEIAEITILTFTRSRQPGARVALSDKVSVHYLPGQSVLALPTRALLDLMRTRALARHLRIDLAHGQGITGQGHLATSAHPVAVVTAHGMLAELSAGVRDSILQRARLRMTESMVRKVMAGARVVISTSGYDAATLAGLARGACVSIPNPVAPEFFDWNGGPDPGNELLFAGMLVPRKNVDGMLRAFTVVRSSVPNAHLTVAGPAVNNEYAAVLRQVVAEQRLGDSVTFLGHVENEELAQRMRQCSGLVLFSRSDTSPTVIGQAMAAGKPVVATRVGGIPELVVDGQTGWLVDSEDESALARRLVELLSSPEQRRTLGENAREVALRKFEPAAVARQTLKAYQMALSLCV